MKATAPAAHSFGSGAGLFFDYLTPDINATLNALTSQGRFGRNVGSSGETLPRLHQDALP